MGLVRWNRVRRFVGNCGSGQRFVRTGSIRSDKWPVDNSVLSLLKKKCCNELGELVIIVVLFKPLSNDTWWKTQRYSKLTNLFICDLLQCTSI